MPSLFRRFVLPSAGWRLNVSPRPPGAKRAIRIYLIRNLVNGKTYVGQTIQALWKRYRQHTNGGRNHCGRFSLITRAIRKYGIENFTIEKLGLCWTSKEADAIEGAMAEFYHAFAPEGYTLVTGKSNWRISPVARQRILKGHQYQRGVPMPLETRLKISRGHIGIRHTPAVLKRIGMTRRRKFAALRKIDPNHKIFRHLGDYVLTHFTKPFHLIAPDGAMVSGTNLRAYARSMGVSSSGLFGVVSGRWRYSHGYSADPAYLTPEQIERLSKKRKSPFFSCPTRVPDGGQNPELVQPGDGAKTI